MQYEIQAYVLNELYHQTYGHRLDAMRFVFLQNGAIFDARCLSESKSNEVVAGEIDAAIAGIAAGAFERRVGQSSAPIAIGGLIASPWCAEGLSRTGGAGSRASRSRRPRSSQRRRASPRPCHNRAATTMSYRGFYRTPSGTVYGNFFPVLNASQ